MEFDEALERFGFHLREERGFGHGAHLHVANPNRYLTFTVHAYPDGTAIFSWEFALGEYLAERGLQVGSDEALNQFVFPREDLRGRQDGAWLIGAIEQTEAMLSTIRLDRPSA
jgi:hypothetical protein